MMNKIAELARKAQNVEELISLAKEAGIELALEEAKKLFAQVSDEGLADVAGGSVGDVAKNLPTDFSPMAYF